VTGGVVTGDWVERFSPGRGLPGVGVVERDSATGLGVWLLDDNRPPSLNSACGNGNSWWRNAGQGALTTWNSSWFSASD
jgi:hypothetical protein